MGQRKITIVGAGQSGLQLGLGLLQAGYGVRLVSNRTPEEIRDGRVASSQCMFATPLAHERSVGIDQWLDAPPVEGIGVSVPHPDTSGTKLFGWRARLDAPAQSIDQRIKYPALMELFAGRGGELVFEDANVGKLERYAREDDLVIVAAGKGEIARLFTRDATRSVHDAPQRALALTYVHGLAPEPEYSTVSFNLIPGVGEYFVFPALTLSGPCHIMVFEGVPGGPMDSWADLGPEEHFENSLRILRTFLPWEADRAAGSSLTDPMGVLQGRYPPTVRHPVATLPSGRSVLGMADVVVLNDPITGQGTNNASRCAQVYLEQILAHGDAGFDAAFQRATFEAYFAQAKPIVDWTNALLAPPPPHVLNLLGSAGRYPEIAARFANGFDNPADFGEWFLDPIGAEEYLDAAATRAATNTTPS
ncbi:FAD-binding oxidoreductase [Paeniglutamicibacter sp. ABSL32-1]|uniref:styrene monooxygenase/indole monooxygenase family protein n=1 Tax=Paeniglutamicibacter quisquiliarum TaxID=2849498 RepID=UPI001C2D7EEC|nr:styrene monooxygenase/indole monooxygenase family protein [Paeniglutamicibacter quisquiliarum]MBV1781237.1 FAD-binding oxidoreductase [Paeniglutamicibacter quisquiliarum]